MLLLAITLFSRLKGVKAITWGVIFIDMDTQKELQRRKYYFKRELAPGDEKTLTRYVLPYTKAGTTIQAVIDRVEYDDGSVWQHP